MAATSITISQYHFDNLRLILWEANLKYSSIAAVTRCNLNLTHWARTRAQKLGLFVNIKAAVNCPQRAVSVDPLPILERTPSYQCELQGQEHVRVNTLPFIYATNHLSPLRLTPSPDAQRCKADVPRVAASMSLCALGKSGSMSVPPVPVKRHMDLPVTSSATERSFWETDMEIGSDGGSSFSFSSDSDTDDTDISEYELDADFCPSKSESDSGPIMIRIKRKSFEMEDSEDQCKRTRYMQ